MKKKEDTCASLKDYLVDTAKTFGMVLKNNERAIPNAIFRCAPEVNYPFCAFIDVEQAETGIYRDCSFVVFLPDQSSGSHQCVVAFAIGSDGFQNDYEKATLPGVRRAYRRIISQIHQDEERKKRYPAVYKTSFADIETDVSRFCESAKDINPSLQKTVAHYGKCIFAAMYIPESDSDEGRNVLATWLAVYADFRNWQTSQEKENAVEKALKPFQGNGNQQPDEGEQIYQLLNERHYVVLQGAPGTGKSYHTAKMAQKDKFKENVFFTQLHAETTYSDFVYGIMPNVSNDKKELKYVPNEGVLYQALKKVKEGKDVLLIIDEINRANLSHVLGEAFYLFERNCAHRDIGLKIGGLSINHEMFERIEKHLYVLATMNTSDRSLAVIDFALRRRFAWYTLRPHCLSAAELAHDGLVFHHDLFQRFSNLFEKYATDEELNLQPGHSFFITEKKESAQGDSEAMKNRMKYELLPLIKEYLQEGYLVNAKNDFCQLFFGEIHCDLYE